jgi:hypothetical protein
MFGDDFIITDGGRQVGFKDINDYDLKDVTDEQLADDPDLDVNTRKLPCILAFHLFLLICC